MKNFGEKYYLGLDLGTSSVGWAVTDENYELRRAKGKDLWGSRLFSEASTSVERRTHRAGRRRKQRERARIGMLRSYFEEEITKIDPGFFVRLEESKFHREDRSENNMQKYALFSDKDFNDIDYYNAYPTIFHLRQKLIRSDDPVDIRLVYLALHNMFKHRGNFLNASLGNDEVSDIKTAWVEFVTTAEMFDIYFDESLDVKKLESLLGEKGASRSKISENICQFLDVKKSDKRMYELIQIICGKTAKLINIYGEIIIDSDHKALSLCFRDSNYDEKALEVEEYIGSEYFELINSAKKIHDIGLLANIMKGYKYLTDARVDIYESHKADLKLLKNVLLKYDKDAYDKMFRTMEPGSYSAYVGSVNSDKTKIRRNEGKGRSTEDLYKTIKQLISSYDEDEDVKQILSKIESETFLQKQLTSANGVIPNQVYVMEMKAILSNAEKYLPFLKQKDEYNLTVSDRILQLFSFRLPYYVGPLGQEYLDKEGYNVWAERIAPGKVLPWNLEEKIDTKRAAEKFIERMVRKCSYLRDENTLPKQSLLYEKFMVLNELNNLRVYGEKISVEIKQDIYNTLFMKGSKVKIKQLEDYFRKNGIVESNAVDFLSGIDVETGFKASLSSIGKFKGIFGEDIVSEKIQNMIEKIIFWGTVYGDDKSFIKDRIKTEFSDVLDDASIKRILGFKFNGWGNLSREFLEMPGKDENDKSIIFSLWETNDNLMELLSDKHTYKEKLEEITKIAEKSLSEWTPDDLDGMYLSAPVKRMIWQTIKIMKELVEVTGHTPDRVFVEMPREDGEKGKRTDSRKKKLLELYNALGKEGKQWKSEIENLSEAELRRKKLYLYYVQMGKCMYSGEIIDLDRLLSDNDAYDIDHIYPRHYIKDDSIENNLVLVKKQYNANKSDKYPLSQEIRDKQHKFWGYLVSHKLISREKYNRLIRNTSFTDEEKAKFISRQLVETRQGTKAITQIIQQAFPDSIVVFSKAGEVSDFRKKHDLIKVRSVNDMHHAKDAYLNVVVGNAYYVKFTKDPMLFIKKASTNKNNNLYIYNMDKIMNYDIVRGDDIGWVAKNDQSISIVKRIMKRNTVLITKRAYVTHGSITRKDTVYNKHKANQLSYMPMSSDERLNDVTKYGGRSDIANQCYCLAEYKVKGKRVLAFEAVPIYLGNIEGLEEKVLVDYLYNVLSIENGANPVTDIQIKIKCVRYNSLIKLNGFYYYLAGKTGNRICLDNSEPLILDYNYECYIKLIEKTSPDMIKDKREDITAEKNVDFYDMIINKCKITDFCKKNNTILNSLEKGHDTFIKLDIEKQVYILLQIIKWFGLGNYTIDLKEIGASNQSGMCLNSKKITDAKEAVLISKSVTGLYEAKVDLLKL